MVCSAYQAFCLRTFLPASDHSLMEWIADLSCNRKTYHAVKNRFTALWSWHVDLGLNTASFKDNRIRRMLWGFKCLHGISTRGQKLPIALPMLSCFVNSLHTLPLLSPHEKATFHGTFTLAYACFLRCVEFMWSTFDPSSTPLAKVSTWLSCTPGLLCALMQPSASSAPAARPWHPSLALVTVSPPSSAPGFLRSSTSSLPAWACWPVGTPATRSGMGLLPGPILWEPPTWLSRPLAAGPLIASSAMSTSRLPRRATCHLSFSALSCDPGVPSHPMDSRPPTWHPAHLPKPALAAQLLGLGVAGPGALEPRVASPFPQSSSYATDTHTPSG
ncbi:uncharacterized protein UHOD_12197 [Ustilago sp. UG-2017b]|nr:uncharacterized protein UHOD_12197 [Ustilago sp. UG-2017b]